MHRPTLSVVCFNSLSLSRFGVLVISTPAIRLFGPALDDREFQDAIAYARSIALENRLIAGD